MVKIDLIHKTLASGQLMNNSLTGEFLYDTPGWTGTPLYTSPPEVNGIACSGTDVKIMSFHNTDDFNDVNIKTYFYNTGEDSRSLNINLPYSDTAEWDFGYVMHLNTGESIYGNAAPVPVYEERNMPTHKTGFAVDVIKDKITLTGHGLVDGDKVYLGTGLHNGVFPGGLETGVGYFVSISGDNDARGFNAEGFSEPDIRFHANKAEAIAVPPVNVINLHCSDYITLEEFTAPATQYNGIWTRENTLVNSKSSYSSAGPPYYYATWSSADSRWEIGDDASGNHSSETNCSAAIDNTWTKVGHSLANGDVVRLTVMGSGAGPTVGQNYYVGNVSGDDFELFTDEARSNVLYISSAVSGATLSSVIAYSIGGDGHTGPCPYSTTWALDGTITDCHGEFELYKDYASTVNYHIYGAELLSGTA